MQHKNNNYIMLLNPAGQIQYACSNSIDRFQLSSGQLNQLAFAELKHPDMPEGPLKDLQEVVALGRPWMGVIQLQDSAGEFWVNAYVVPVTDQGQVLELHCILNEADSAMTERARETYRLRKAGKMPRRLRRSVPTLAVRSGLAGLLAFIPLIVFAATRELSIGMLAALVVSVGLLFIFHSILFGPYNRLVHSTRRIVEHPIKQLIYTNTNDDVGQLQLTLDMQQVQMRALLQRMQNTSGQISVHAGQTMQGMQRIFADVEHQQGILNQLGQSAGAMSDSAAEINLQVEHNVAQSQTATEQVGLGQETLQSSIDSMHRLAESIEESIVHFSRLQQKSEQINAIMTVIQAVAEQTNLLALNAAIEAARAGEMGRGFAVVADEVRSLAAKTQSSTQDIQNMINDLQEATGAISQCLTSEQELSTRSVHQIEQAGSAFRQILGFIHQLHDNMAALQGLSQQQDAVALQVNQGVEQLQDLTAEARNDAGQALEYNQSMATISERQSMMLEGLSQA